MNFQLLRNFKKAAAKCKLEVEATEGFYCINIPNTNRYIYCWTPLNKLNEVIYYAENKKYDDALDQLEKWCNFHLEIDSYTHNENIMEAFIDVNKHDLTVHEIVDIINDLQDDVKIQQRLMWVRLKYQD